MGKQPSNPTYAAVAASAQPDADAAPSSSSHSRPQVDTQHVGGDVKRNQDLRKGEMSNGHGQGQQNEQGEAPPPCE